MIETTTKSEQQTEDFAASLAAKLSPGAVIAFRGGLGAGKTAFVRGLARGLEIRADVSSPTFALINEYRDGTKLLAHFDMYRITDFDSLYATGFFDYLDGAAILAIEWSENIETALPPGHFTVTLTPLDETTRHITVEGGPVL